MILSVTNNLTKEPSTVRTFLSTAITSGGTTIPVKNINSFQDQWAVQIGETGESQAEIQVISGTPSGTALNTSGTFLYNHNIDTPIYQLHYDKIIWLRSTSGTTGTPSAIATTAITPNLAYTEYNDASGAATYAYQVQYYNSVSGDTSGTSSWFTPGGPSFYSLQKLRQRAQDALYSANYIRNDTIVNDWINEWLEIMTNGAIKVNQGYSVGTAQYAFSPATGNPAQSLVTITDSLFKQAYKVEVTTDGVHWINSREIPNSQWSNGDYFSSLDPRHYWFGDNVLGILPNTVSGTVQVTYGKRTTPLSNDSDELPQSMKAYTTGCIEYVLYRAFDLDQKQSLADDHYQKFILYQNAFIAEITPRDQSSEKYINILDSLSGMDESVNLVNEYFF